MRQTKRRNAIQQPRRTAAKTYVAVAIRTAGEGDAEATRKAVATAVSALDLAAKSGAIHANAAARRKSRLMRGAEAALGGESLVTTGKPQRQVGKAAAAKAAKARIAAGKASKAKGEQTAAGKARAALSKSARTTDAKPAKKATASKTTAKAKTATKAKAKAKAKTTKASASKTKSAGSDS